MFVVIVFAEFYPYEMVAHYGPFTKEEAEEAAKKAVRYHNGNEVCNFRLLGKDVPE